MGKKILFAVLGVLVGGFVGMLCNMGLVQLNMGLHPPPEGYDPKDMAQLASYIGGLPSAAFLVVLLAHQSQAFVGALLGTLISGRRSFVVAWILGAFTLLGCVIMLMIAKGPLWFTILDVVLPLPLAWLGAKLVMKKAETAEDA